MTDPREILKAAGVECPEVEKVVMSRGWYDARASHQQALNIIEIDDAAILALARLVAKYKWLFTEAQEYDWNFSMGDRDYENVLADLDRRWEERNG